MQSKDLRSERIETEDELIDQIADLASDPLAYVHFAYPWGEPGELEHEKPREWQEEILGSIRDHLSNPETRFEPLRISVASGHGIGKALALDELTPTPSGVRLWGSLQPGDEVYDEYGNPVRIKAVKHFNDCPMYRVHFDDRSFLDVSEGHLWAVRGRQDRRKGVQGFRVMETIEIIRKGVLRPNGKAMARQWEIPVQGPVQYPKNDLPIHPYLLGVWLGDGSKGRPRFTKYSHEIDERLRLLGYELSIGVDGSRYVTGVHSKFKGGVFECGSHERFIPGHYLYSSIEDRFALFQGLCDTYGEVHASGSIGYSTTSLKLATDMIQLARSLGFKAMLQETPKEAYYIKDGDRINCKDCYKVTINAPVNPFTVLHKKEAFKPSEHRYTVRWIDRIEPVGKTDAMCIEVESESGLFQASLSHIVTHNSALIGQVINWALSTCEDTKVVVTANTEPQLRNKTWPEVSKWFRLAINANWFRLNATSIHVVDPEHDKSWRADAVTWSENNTEAFAGLHNKGKRILVVFDEASAISDKVWEVTEGALTDENTEIIWIAFGNPTRNSGAFRECFRKFRHRWINKQIDSRTVKGTNKVQIKKWIEDYGEDSDFVKIRVRGLFPSLSMKQFISGEDVDRAYGKHLREEEYNWAPKIISVDPAWEGDDECIIALRQGLAFKILKRYAKNDNDVAMANIIARLEDEHKADAVFIDGGYGTGIVSVGRTLKRNWQLVWFAEKPDDEGCLNKRAEMWKLMRDWLKEGGAIPEDPVLRDELTSVETIPRMDGKIQLESKKDMKKRGVPSPNRADALAITFAFHVQASKSLGLPTQGTKVITEWNPES